MSEWITDRRPTADDADSKHHVWVSQDGEVFLAKYWSTAAQDLCDAWNPKVWPAPYEPPNPDTSLAASIEREQAYLPEHGMACIELGTPKRICRICDKKRILEAAKSTVCDSPAPCEPPKPVRRELKLVRSRGYWRQWNPEHDDCMDRCETMIVREVLPTDPTPEMIEEMEKELDELKSKTKTVRKKCPLCHDGLVDGIDPFRDCQEICEHCNGEGMCEFFPSDPMPEAIEELLAAIDKPKPSQVTEATACQAAKWILEVMTERVNLEAKLRGESDA